MGRVGSALEPVDVAPNLPAARAARLKIVNALREA